MAGISLGSTSISKGLLGTDQIRIALGSAILLDKATPPTGSSLYIGSDGQIMIKAGTYKASVMDMTTGKETIQDYVLATDTEVRWSIPETYKNIEGTLAAKEDYSVPAVAADLSIPDIGNFNIAAEPIAWSAVNWGTRRYQQDTSSGTSGTDFTIKFSKSQYYGGYQGTLESGSNNCTYKVRQLMSFKVPETGTYQFNYGLTTGPKMNSSNKSPITFNLYKKSDSTLLYTKSSTISVRSSNDTGYASLSFEGDKISLTKDEELYADITMDALVRYGGSTAGNNFYSILTFDQYLQCVCTAPSGKQDVSIVINKWGDDDPYISLREYREEYASSFPNGISGTINWTNGAVSSIS